MNRLPIVPVALTAILIAGCSDPIGPSREVASIAITFSEPVLAPGEAVSFDAEARDGAGTVITDADIAWSSAAPSVVSVTVDGHVTAVVPGSAVLTASAEGREAAVTVTVAPNLQVMSVGGLELCGLTAGGDAFCGPHADVLSPVPAGAPLRWLSSGYDFSCGVTGSGEGVCWGRNGDAQLGRGTQSGEGAVLGPAPVSGGLEFTRISAGSQHACGIVAGNVAYCWGENASGQLGDGSTARALVPVAVGGGHTFFDIDADLGITCGLAPDGGYCWGVGFLGSAGVHASDVPVGIAGGYPFHFLSVGPNHACAITSTNQLYCWGAELGGGTAEEPVETGGSLRFTAVSVEESTTCALTSDGEAYCTERFLSVPLSRFTERAFARLDAGGGGACAATSGGAAFCSGGFFSPPNRPADPAMILRVPLVE